MSAEMNCFPACAACKAGAQWYAQHRPSNTSYRYLNSGGFIGPVDLILRMVDSVIDWHNPPRFENDQKVWQARLAVRVRPLHPTGSIYLLSADS